jgi:hypothetical protein
VILEEDCTIQDGIATCTNYASIMGTATSDVETETAVPFAIQGGNTLAAASTPTAGASVSGAGPVATSAAPSSGAPAVSGPSQTAPASVSQTSPAPSQTKSTNGVGKLQSGAVASIFSVGMAFAVLL